MTVYRYPIDLEPDETGRTVARAPDLIGCVTDGATPEEALTEIADAIDEALAAAMAAREPIPEPSPARGRPTVAPSATLAAKAALYGAMRAQGLSNVALAERLHVQETEVRRMLDSHHATKIGRLEKALALMGKRLVVGVEAA